ncbi:MAG: hypothetical protein GTO16_10590 [Candidatus Aminicenantes bacterium]|nr:hypothetical protein [Candidatus Aminicenantes bacterium]
MEPAEYIVVTLNLVAGFSVAFPLSRLFSRLDREPPRVFRFYVILIGIYFLECVAIVSMMLVPVLSIGLAFIWGASFGLWLRARTSPQKALKASLYLSLYSSLPVVSFIVVPVLALSAGRPILSADEGASFGIPNFIPWPMNTILGFYTILAIGVLVLKTVIITGGVSLLFHLKEKPKTESTQE